MFKEQKSSMDKSTTIVEQTFLLKESALVTFADLDLRDEEWRGDVTELKCQTMQCMQLLAEASSSPKAAPSTPITSSLSLAASYFDGLVASFQDDQCINQFASILDFQILVSEQLWSSPSCTPSPPSAASSRTPTTTSSPFPATSYPEDRAAAPSSRG
ncbi:unnamed protein product [Prorocentrum cordatum]|uniref:Uncharacterized protein n=1 Tax=Prorocentrum cordatum TaxID=2364126 RepID=A0ABN9SZQ8_9DINO|nr:unnamed protein product [Polarella glacialis]